MVATAKLLLGLPRRCRLTAWAGGVVVAVDGRGMRSGIVVPHCIRGMVVGLAVVAMVAVVILVLLLQL
jgi:hypothetical protein